MSHTRINTIELRQVLDEFTKELKMGFLEKRGRTNSHRDSPVDELKDTVRELSDRERQLQAAVGIAKMLLDDKENSQQQLEIRTQKAEIKKQENVALRAEIEIFKEELTRIETKYEETCEVLMKAEEELLAVQNENHRLVVERNNAVVVQRNNGNQYEKEVEELSSSYLAQIEQLSKNRGNWKTTIKSRDNTIKQLENELIFLKKQLSKTKKENEKNLTKNKITENELETTLETLEITEKSLQKASLAHLSSVKTVKQLEEELFVLENAKQPIQRPVTEHTDGTLYTELMLLEPPTSPKLQNPMIFKSIGCILIAARYPGRRNPDEEYFALATQAVKMNSPYIDAICTIPTEHLFKKALSLQIPFNKWYTWIEDELNSAYIHMIYRRDLQQKSIKSNRKLGAF